MKRLLVAVAACAAVVVAYPSSATAWTHCGTPQAEADCPPITVCLDGVETQVPDNGTYTPGECPPPPPKECEGGNPPDNEGNCPPEQPPVVPPVTPPVTPPVVPPPTVPDVPPTIHETPVVPDKPTEVINKEQQNGGHGGNVEGNTPERPQEANTGTSLPFTGFNLAWSLAAGVALLGGGLFLRRRVV